MAVVFFAAIAAIVVISGCGAGRGDRIWLADLAAEQQDIVSLLTTHGQEALIFNYRTDSAFEAVDFWIELYAYGEPVEHLGGLSFRHGNAGNALDGRLAVQEDGFRSSGVVDFVFDTETLHEGRDIILHMTNFIQVILWFLMGRGVVRLGFQTKSAVNGEKSSFLAGVKVGRKNWRMSKGLFIRKRQKFLLTERRFDVII